MKHPFLLAACLCLLSCDGTRNNGNIDTAEDYADWVITPEFIDNIRPYERSAPFMRVSPKHAAMAVGAHQHPR